MVPGTMSSLTCETVYHLEHFTHQVDLNKGLFIVLQTDGLMFLQPSAYQATRGFLQPRAFKK